MQFFRKSFEIFRKEKKNRFSTFWTPIRTPYAQARSKAKITKIGKNDQNVKNSIFQDFETRLLENGALTQKSDLNVFFIRIEGPFSTFRIFTSRPPDLDLSSRRLAKFGLLKNLQSRYCVWGHNRGQECRKSTFFFFSENSNDFRKNYIKII